MLRADLATLGIAARDRITSRSGHPTRLLLDRVARQLGRRRRRARDRAVGAAHARARAGRAVDRRPAVVREAARAGADGGPGARGGARSRSACPGSRRSRPPQIEALLVAAARQVVKGYGDRATRTSSRSTRRRSRARSRAASESSSRSSRRTSRRRKPRSRRRPTSSSRPWSARELRAAFLVSGRPARDARGDAPARRGAARRDRVAGTRALATLLEHPLAGDLVRFALTPEATRLRRRLGSTAALSAERIGFSALG